MQERMIMGVLAVFCLGVMLALGLGVRVVWQEHDQERDFGRWVETPARLESLSVWRDSDRGASRWHLTCEYAYEVGGTHQRGTRCAFRTEGFSSLDEATHWVRTQLVLPVPPDWTADGCCGLQAVLPQPTITVLRSPRYPAVSVLAREPPHPGWQGYLVIALLAVLMLLFGLTSLALLAACWTGAGRGMLGP